jgi:hypothetical protein
MGDGANGHGSTVERDIDRKHDTRRIGSGRRGGFSASASGADFNGQVGGPRGRRDAWPVDRV